jgi:recombination associated protein RdgC
MWFNHALVYHYQLADASKLEDALKDKQLKPCPPHARFVHGFLPVDTDLMVQQVAGASLICFGKEERLLPRSVINKLLEEKVAALEAEQGRPLKRSECAQMAEALEFELLPKAFCIEKKMPAILDDVESRLIINTSSPQQAASLLTLLRQALKIEIQPLKQVADLALKFAQWIQNPNLLPQAFQLSSDCLLFSLDDEKKRVQCRGYELPAAEILNLLSQNMATAEISLIWRDRIHFTLTHELVFKKLRCLDYLIDEFQDLRSLEEERQQQDAALTLLSGELRALFNELFTLVLPKSS